MKIDKRMPITTTLKKETFNMIRQLIPVYGIDNKNHIIEKAIENEIDRLRKEGVIK